MFDDLFNFQKERLPLQALGFYIVCLVIIIPIVMLGSTIFATDFDSGFAVGWIIAFIYCPF